MLLSFNTASLKSSVALLESGKLIAEISWLSDADESEKLLKNILQLFNKKKGSSADLSSEARRAKEEVLRSEAKHGRRRIKFSDLQKILVISGPGSYTSLRVGITVANTLAYGLKIPVYSLTLFDLMALRLKEKIPAHLLINAGRGEVYYKSSKSKVQNPNKIKNSKLVVSEVEPLKIQNSTNIQIIKLEELVKKLDHKQKEIFVAELKNEQHKKLKEMSSKKWKILTEKNLLTFGQAVAKLDFKQLKNENLIKPFYIRPPDITVKKITNNQIPLVLRSFSEGGNIKQISKFRIRL